MLCKWITTTVPPDTREAFSAAQRRWSAISDQPGLIGQIGGWNTTTGTAHVLALWRDRASHRSFMCDRHNTVISENQQVASYTSIEVVVGEAVFAMAGEVSELRAALGDAVLLRVADCRVLPGRDGHFIDVQRRVWAPGMASAGGMLAGCFVQAERHRYLVATCWSTVQAHRRYTTEDVPGLRACAGLDGDVAAVAGHVLVLEPQWRVLPTP